jgi:hypothetical protein
MRHRIVRTKGALSAKTAKLMVFKLINAAGKTIASRIFRVARGSSQLHRAYEQRRPSMEFLTGGGGPHEVRTVAWSSTATFAAYITSMPDMRVTPVPLRLYRPFWPRVSRAALVAP